MYVLSRQRLTHFPVLRQSLSARPVSLLIRAAARQSRSGAVAARRAGGASPQFQPQTGLADMCARQFSSSDEKGDFANGKPTIAYAKVIIYRPIMLKFVADSCTRSHVSLSIIEEVAQALVGHEHIATPSLDRHILLGACERSETGILSQTSKCYTLRSLGSPRRAENVS